MRVLLLFTDITKYHKFNLQKEYKNHKGTSIIFKKIYCTKLSLTDLQDIDNVLLLHDVTIPINFNNIITLNDVINNFKVVLYNINKLSSFHSRKIIQLLFYYRIPTVKVSYNITIRKLIMAASINDKNNTKIVTDGKRECCLDGCFDGCLKFLKRLIYYYLPT